MIWMSKNRTIFTILLILLLFTTAGCLQDHVDIGSSNTSSLPDYGRLVATDMHTNNLMNAGYMVGYGNSTLFTLRNGDKAVYKIDKRNKTSKLIDEIQASQLLVNDKYVFVVDHEDYPDSSFGIYRFKPGGSKPQMVCQNDRQMFAVFCDDEWVYYCVHNIIICHADEPPPGEEPRMYEYYTLYKVKSDGKKIYKVLSYIDNLNLPYISDGWIYYTTFDDNISLYRVDWEGQNRHKVISQERVQDVSIVGEWVYFHVVKGNTWPLYRIKMNGTGEEIICTASKA